MVVSIIEFKIFGDQNLNPIFETKKIKGNFPLGWGCGVYRLYLGRGVRCFPQSVSRYDTKTFDGKASVLEIWGIWSTLIRIGCIY